MEFEDLDSVQFKQQYGKSNPQNEDRAPVLDLIHRRISCINATVYRNKEGKVDDEATNNEIESQLARTSRYCGFKYEHDKKRRKVKVIFNARSRGQTYNFSWVPSSATVPGDVRERFESYLESL